MISQWYLVSKGLCMAGKKYKIITLIKVAVISFFSAQIFVAARYPEYEKLKRDGYNMMKLFLAAIFLVIISGSFGAESIIFQGCFILYGVFFVCALVYIIINMFKVWRFFFKERLEKEDKQE
jgi:hypothetical protein